MYWWEIVEMARRFVLVGLMVLYQDSMLQMILGVFLAATFLLIQVQAAPYLELADDYLASTVSLCLVFLFVVSTTFKYAALIDLNDIQDKMSAEQKGLYVMSIGTLTAVTIASILGALFASLVIFLAQLAHESARLRREALMSKARRLRYVADGADVQAPKLTHGPLGSFHVFLSHGEPQLLEPRPLRTCFGMFLDCAFSWGGSVEHGAGSKPYFEAAAPRNGSRLPRLPRRR